MSDYPRLKEMGIQNPQEIEKFAFYTADNADVLHIVYDRKKGSLLPVSRRYRFPQVRKSVRVDSGSGKTQMLHESAPAFREALGELERLKTKRAKNQDRATLIREELRLLEEDIALRTQYIRALVDKL